MKLLIKNAAVYDPKNGKNGEIGDLFIRDGKISKPYAKPDTVIDASGLWALPGGVETGVPLTSYGLGVYGFKKGFPGPEEISRQYAQMGYTHLHESMMFPTMATGTHHFLTTLPYQDASASLCLTLREFGTLIGSNIPPEWTVRFFATCAQRFRALAIRLPETSAHFKESTLAKYNLPAQRVLQYLTHLPLNLPLHVELTSRLLDEDLPQIPNLHYAHIGRAIDGEYAYKQVSNLLASKNITGDTGLAPKGPHDQLKIEAEIGEGEALSAFIGMHTPLRYLEVPAGSQSEYVLSLATHPDFKKNLAFSSLCLGAQAPTHYPGIFKDLFEAGESYTVSDFVTQTRWMPAVQLGLSDKGHLGMGAVGDVALYKPEEGRSRGETLSRCVTLVKNGHLVMDKGRFLELPVSFVTRTYYRPHTPSERDLAMFRGYFKSYPRFEHLEVPEALGSWLPVTADST